MKRNILIWFRTIVTMVVVGTLAMMVFSLRGELRRTKAALERANAELRSCSIKAAAQEQKKGGVYVLCRFDLKADADIAAYKKKTLGVIPQVHAEKGCRLYTLLEDAKTDWEAPKRFGERTFWMVEKWDSIEDLKAHLQAPHMKAFAPTVSGMRSSSTFHVLEEVR